MRTNCTLCGASALSPICCKCKKKAKNIRTLCKNNCGHKAEYKELCCKCDPEYAEHKKQYMREYDKLDYVVERRRKLQNKLYAEKVIVVPP